VKGLQCARHVQNSDANWSNESDFPWARERKDNKSSPNSIRGIGLTAFPLSHFVLHCASELTASRKTPPGANSSSCAPQPAAISRKFHKNGVDMTQQNPESANTAK
jgi:hypothetical protein